MMAVFVILGGMIQGHQVMKTVGKGIGITEAEAFESHNSELADAQFWQYFPDQRLPDKAILVALLSAGFFVTLATFSKVPVSTSQAIVGGVAGAVAAIQDHESRADMLKWEIGEALQSGAFMPVARSDVYRLVESVDKLAGRGEDLAIFLSNQPPDIAVAFQADYTTIPALNVDSTEQLHDALEIYFKPKGKLKALHAHTRQVGQLESEVDQRQGSLMQQIFGSNLDLSAKMHLGQLLGVICGISDAAEDVADELAFAALKSAV